MCDIIVHVMLVLFSHGTPVSDSSVIYQFCKCEHTFNIDWWLPLWTSESQQIDTTKSDTYSTGSTQEDKMSSPHDWKMLTGMYRLASLKTLDSASEYQINYHGLGEY